MEVPGKGYKREDDVNANNGDAVGAIHNSPDDLDALHDAGKFVEPLMMKRRGTAIRVRGELADRIGTKRQRGRVITPNPIDVLFDHLDHLRAHAVCPDLLVVSMFSM